jgi:hypothetical protein
VILVVAFALLLCGAVLAEELGTQPLNIEKSEDKKEAR